MSRQTGYKAGPHQTRLDVHFSILRLVYLVFLPIAGCLMIQRSGFVIGRGWGLGIAMGLFIHHYLLWALYETERLERPANQLWIQFCSPVIILFAVWGNWRDWLIEQTIVETGAFVAAIAILALWKGLLEGRSAPWLLILLILVLPGVAVLYRLTSFWWERHGNNLSEWDFAFLLSTLLSTLAQIGRLKPFTIGHDTLTEPLSSGRRTVFAVVWLILLLAGGMVIGS